MPSRRQYGAPLTHVTQVRLHDLHHAYLRSMAHEHDGSMGAYLRALVAVDMVDAAERVHAAGGPDHRAELSQHLEFDGELQGAAAFAAHLAELHREWLAREQHAEDLAQDVAAADDDAGGPSE